MPLLVVRLVVVVVGLIAVVYAGAILAGVPPLDDLSPPRISPLASVAISVGVGALGLAAVALAAWSRRRAYRIAFGALGVATAVYGVAWLTGGWLGVPPWTIVTSGLDMTDVPPGTPSHIEYDPPLIYEGRRAESYGIAAGVVGAGLALVAYAGWPRRSNASAPASLSAPSSRPD